MNASSRGMVSLEKQRRKNILKALFCFIFISTCLSYAVLLKRILTSSINNEIDAAAPTSAAADDNKNNKTRQSVRTGSRYLLYITTHMSEHHLSFLQHCWPLAVQNSPQLLQQSDIMVFSTNPDNVNMTKQEINLFYAAFPNNKVILHDYGSSTLYPDFDKSYHEGAKLPMMEAFRHHWFDTYDWVIRVNLDVVIRNDTWMVATMENDDDVDGIFTDCFGRNPTCQQNCTSHIIHSDFFAFRPRAIPRDTPCTQGLGWSDTTSSAEIVTSRMFREYIVKNGRDRWLPNAAPHKQALCRLSGASVKNPVTHYHEETGKNENSTQLCIEYFLQYGSVTGNKSTTTTSSSIGAGGSDNNDNHLSLNHHQTVVVLDENF
jgi:hypothetical protein